MALQCLCLITHKADISSLSTNLVFISHQLTEGSGQVNSHSAMS